MEDKRSAKRLLEAEIQQLESDLKVQTHEYNIKVLSTKPADLARMILGKSVEGKAALAAKKSQMNYATNLLSNAKDSLQCKKQGLTSAQHEKATATRNVPQFLNPILYLRPSHQKTSAIEKLQVEISDIIVSVISRYGENYIENHRGPPAARVPAQSNVLSTFLLPLYFRLAEMNHQRNHQLRKGRLWAGILTL